MDLDATKKTRRPFRTQVTKLRTEIDALLLASPVDKTTLELKIEVLNEFNQKMEEMDTVVIEKMVEEGKTDAEVDAEMQIIADYKQKVKQIQKAVYNILSIVVSGGGAQDHTAAQRNFKLPKIVMKTFNGDLKEWLGFWSQFQKIDSDKGLHASDKFQYLVQAMGANTEAYEIVNSYPLTEENYPKAVESLKKRYGDNDLLLQVYVRELLNLVISNVTAKDKVPISKMYLQLESHLRSLKSLNLEKADPATWLFPLVESSLTEEVLVAWQRSPFSSKDGKAENPPKTRLDYLMEFLEGEVQIKQKITLAQSSFQMHTENGEGAKKSKKKADDKVPTLAGFHISDTNGCVFCGKNHLSQECFSARRMPYEEKKKLIIEKKACFNCLKGGHMSSKCKAQVMCFTCNGKHHHIMCNKDAGSWRSQQPKKEASPESVPTRGADWTHNKDDQQGGFQKTFQAKSETFNGASNHVCTSKVLLSTLLVDIIVNDRKKTARLFFDNGSQRSYILKTTAEDMGMNSTGVEPANHSLFLGGRTGVIYHKKYNVTIAKLGGGYQCTMPLRDSTKISNPIPRIPRVPTLFRQLKEEKIYVTDVGEGLPEIEILIGNDFQGRLLTGKVVQLEGGLTAQETKLGWVLSGQHGHGPPEDTVSMMVSSLTAFDAPVEDMWSLEKIGIQDDTEAKSAKQMEQEAKNSFMKTIKRNDDGRYVIALPWLEDHPPLPTNRYVAEKRLQRETKRLLDANKFTQYDNLLKEWTQDFIEEVVVGGTEEKHLIPHRPVFKESLTTPVRPVFDCSCKAGGAPSLNDCLQKGANYILRIPDLLLRFREKKVGYTADIRKAFQMIEVQENDRRFLRFLWWESSELKKMVEYQHVRVLFGATCSPFILGAVLEYHLKNVAPPDADTGRKLLEGFYVDNFLCSENTAEEYQQVKEAATRILADAKMDLRMWMSDIDNFEDASTHDVSILGIRWDRLTDHLYVSVSGIEKPEKRITKRMLLSTIQKVFDPLGFLSPAMIPMKTILQKSFVNELKWDMELPEEDHAYFRKWFGEIPRFEDIRLPRFVGAGESCSLHTFTDASSIAYASVTYLRVVTSREVKVQLLMSKARVAPVKKMTIPRLELMGCLIGSRVSSLIKNAINLQIPEYYWSDSTTALAWIKNDYNHQVFVRNRVKEIREKTRPADWRHVPGTMNPADLPSRGCLPEELLESKWWEGPAWLLKPTEDWPSTDEPFDEEEVMKEVRKESTVMSSMCISSFRNDQSYHKTVRIMAWVRRYLNNLNRKKTKQQGDITVQEFNAAELAVLKEIQEESPVSCDGIEKMQVILDCNGLMRLQTRLTNRNDVTDFKQPIIIPKRHPLVFKLIMEAHLKNCHAGTQFLIAHLRERFWIVQTRKTIKSVLNKCHRCRRYASKAAVVEMAPLPEDRVKDGNPFEVTGVDLAGPMQLRNGKKVWLVIYTCALYRAVFLDLVPSLSTKAFIKSMKRFVDKHGRPVTVYSDNGTNFVGADNLFKAMDWEAIMKTEECHPIQWKFNPPSAAWWGGFWERLIRSVKDLMRRMLGKAAVTMQELHVCVKKVEEVMNGRPLTYVSEDPDDLETLTPRMFLQTPARVRFPEGEMAEGEKLRIRHNYMKTLAEELKKRFRQEYLSLLVAKPNKTSRPLRVGEIVFIGCDNHKRLDWKMGRILEFFPGKDGVHRTARLKTDTGELTRPVQRLHSLELDQEVMEKVKTRCGRAVKAPDRLGFQ